MQPLCAQARVKPKLFLARCLQVCRVTCGLSVVVDRTLLVLRKQDLPKWIQFSGVWILAGLLVHCLVQLCSAPIFWRWRRKLFRWICQDFSLPRGSLNGHMTLWDPTMTPSVNTVAPSVHDMMWPRPNLCPTKLHGA